MTRSAPIRIDVGRARYRRNLSQAALAEKAGIAVAHAQRIEYGTSGCSIRTLLQLCRSLDRIDIEMGDETYTIFRHVARPGEPVPLDNVSHDAVAVLLRLAQELQEGAEAILRHLPELANYLGNPGDHTHELAAVYEQAVSDVITGEGLAEQVLRLLRPDVVAEAWERHIRKLGERGYMRPPAAAVA